MSARNVLGQFGLPYLKVKVDAICRWKMLDVTCRGKQPLQLAFQVRSGYSTV